MRIPRHVKIHRDLDNRGVRLQKRFVVRLIRLSAVRDDVNDWIETVIGRSKHCNRTRTGSRGHLVYVQDTCSLDWLGYRSANSNLCDALREISTHRRLNTCSMRR